MTEAAGTPPEANSTPSTDQGNATTAEAKPAPSIRELHGDTEPELLKGEKVFFGGKKAEITLAFDDGTADVQLVDDDEKPLRDLNDQPQWTGKVPTDQLFAR